MFTRAKKSRICLESFPSSTEEENRDGNEEEISQNDPVTHESPCKYLLRSTDPVTPWKKMRETGSKQKNDHSHDNSNNKNKNMTSSPSPTSKSDGKRKQGIAKSDQQENVEVEEDETQAKESPPVNLHRSLRSRDSHGEGTTTSTKKNVSSTSSSKQQQQQSPRKGTNSSPKKRSVESSAQEQAGPSFERFVMLYLLSLPPP